jgi:hypothetical protein
MPEKDAAQVHVHARLLPRTGTHRFVDSIGLSGCPILVKSARFSWEKLHRCRDTAFPELPAQDGIFGGEGAGFPIITDGPQVHFHFGV